jgi:hypothetical protein
MNLRMERTLIGMKICQAPPLPWALPHSVGKTSGYPRGSHITMKRWVTMPLCEHGYGRYGNE